VRGSGEGTIEKLRTGVWVGKWSVTTDQGRKWREKRIDRDLAESYKVELGYTGPLTRADAQKTLRILIAESSGQYVKRGAPVKLGDVARQYIALKRGSIWGSHSSRTSANTIELHIINPLGERLISDLNPVELQEHLNGYMAKGSGKSLLHKIVTHLRAICEMAIDMDLIGKNPARKLVYRTIQQKASRFLTIEECRALLPQLEKRDHLIANMLIQLGLRPEELFALRRDDILGSDELRIDETLHEFDEQKIHPETKTLSSADNIHMPALLLEELKLYMAMNPGSPREFLFTTSVGTTLSPRNWLMRTLKPAGVRAGIDLRPMKWHPDQITSGVNYQVLRRTCATHFARIAKPKDAQKQLRHADQATTNRYYIQSIPDSVKAAAKAFERELHGGKP
jgi:integrase